MPVASGVETVAWGPWGSVNRNFHASSDRSVVLCKCYGMASLDLAFPIAVRCNQPVCDVHAIAQLHECHFGQYVPEATPHTFLQNLCRLKDCSRQYRDRLVTKGGAKVIAGTLYQIKYYLRSYMVLVFICLIALPIYICLFILHVVGKEVAESYCSKCLWIVVILIKIRHSRTRLDWTL